MSGTSPTRRLPFPPVWALLSIVAMVALDHFAPGVRLLEWPWRWAGVALIVLGVLSILLCAWLFSRAGTTIKPFERSTALVAKGPYRFTRNPIYLAMVVTLLGTGVLLGSLLPFVVVPFFAAFIDRAFIRREELMMSEAFGADYDEYCRRVRRWI